MNLYIEFHSSAGIGRTGCFIALRNGIKQINKERTVDIVRILCDLRRDRGGMIQTNDQYQFLYRALSEYARTLQSSPR
jgi:protein tyrosine phosphatase